MQIRWYHVTVAGLAILLLIAVFQMISPSNDRDILYQVSAMDLLANGSYDGIVNAKDLKSHGDFGIGTFDGLNGEMIVLNGTIYQATSDGTVHIVNDTASIPFAEVTYFDTDYDVRLSDHYNYSTLMAALDDKLPTKNEFYAISIHDTFPYLKLRSPPMQHKPYPPLAEAIKNQSVFELYNVSGTLVGYYTPGYAKGVGSPGYHLHFISDDHTSGGHVLDLGADGVDVILDETPEFHMIMSP